jgi:hypothetical protein
VDEPSHLLDFFLFDELRGIEVFDLAGDLRVKQRGIESFDARNATAARKQRLPRLFRGIANGGQETNARDYDSAGNKRPLLPGSDRMCTCMNDPFADHPP